MAHNRSAGRPPLQTGDTSRRAAVRPIDEATRTISDLPPDAMGHRQTFPATNLKNLTSTGRLPVARCKVYTGSGGSASDDLGGGSKGNTVKATHQGPNPWLPPQL